MPPIPLLGRAVPEVVLNYCGQLVRKSIQNGGIRLDRDMGLVPPLKSLDLRFMVGRGQDDLGLDELAVAHGRPSYPWPLSVMPRQHL